MKGIDMFCTSQASTAICLSLDQSSSCISPNTIQLGTRAIDRHNPIITDSSRFPPRDTKPHSHHHHHHHSQKILKKSSAKTKGRESHDHKNKTSGKKVSEHVTNNYSSNPINSIIQRSWVRASPAGSSRYLLSEAAFLDNVSSDCDFVASSTPIDDTKPQFALQHETETKPTSSDQVVVLRVSLHCKGCEGKVRKHLSKMEGVTSFNIDFAAKKVTIVGDVTPTSVLASVSKVKNAQFWPASSAAVGSGIAETKK